MSTSANTSKQMRAPAIDADGRNCSGMQVSMELLARPMVAKPGRGRHASARAGRPLLPAHHHASTIAPRAPARTRNRSPGAMPA